MDKVIVIVGPTGVGKTKLSIKLGQSFPAEIISGDSMQIYKGMDIGTGKVTEPEKEGIEHYMLNIKEVNEPFSVAQFQKKVNHYISVIHQKNKIPIIVGGTGLYIQAVLYDYHFSDRKRDEIKTKELEFRLQNEGNEVLYKELVEIDPKHAETIHPNNTKRVIRALEVYETTGLTMSEFHNNKEHSAKYNHYVIGLEMDRDKLYKQIDNRVEQMVAHGLIDEVSSLYKKGYEGTQAMKAIGYKELIPYLKGEIPLDAAISTLKRNSRRYAKRQYTWFKNRMKINWYDMDASDYTNKYEQIITDCNRFLHNEL